MCIFIISINAYKTVLITKNKLLILFYRFSTQKKFRKLRDQSTKKYFKKECVTKPDIVPVKYYVKKKYCCHSLRGKS